MNRIKKWSERASKRKVNVVTFILTSIMLGCYIYLGILISSLIGGY